MSTEVIVLYINGQAYQVEVEEKTTLLEVLRDRLHLMGTKNGCGQGQCGACTVIVDGRAIRSCVYRAKRANGKHIETIEGLATKQELHPLQRAFIDQGAVQCGFCTPGFIMAAKALLDANPRPTREEIISALDRNLCRCTGYAAIIRAIEVAAGIRSPKFSEVGGTPLRVVGLPMPRPDAWAKVTGTAQYTADLHFEGMLYAAVRRSDYPHAHLTRVNTDRAKVAPGVVAVLTAEDIPGKKLHGLIREDWPVLAYDKVRYIGDAIAIVVAETMTQAREACDLVEAEYEPLPVVTSPEMARSPDAPAIHEEGNVLEHIHFRKGDITRGFEQADVIIEREYRTPMTEHLFLEPEACVARLDGQGTLLVYVGSQIPFSDRRQIAASLNIPEERVRVIQPHVGGAFGGKEDISAQIHTALAAWITGRPVKLVYTREESMRTHPKRHATVIRLKTGAMKDGRLTAVEAEILGDTGAYASLGSAVMTRTATHAAGPYEVPNVEVNCYAMYTNNIPAGAFRGFGVPQAAFAIESQMDILAETLGLSPWEIRKINALKIGSRTATGQVLRDSVGLLETIERTKEKVGELGDSKSEVPNVRRAWGIACAYKNVGLGGGLADSAGAEVELTIEGQAIVRAGAAEVGQGLRGVLAQITAEELGLPYESVEVILADTGQTLDGGPTTASRQTFITGNAVRLAARRVRESISQAVAETLDVPPGALTFQGGQIITKGGKRLSLAEAVSLALREGREVKASLIYTPPKTVPLGKDGDMHFAFGYATQAAEVEVNLETGEVRVLRVVAAHDVGRAINPLAVVGQIEGGVVMGLGQALMEQIVMEDGQLITDNLAKYKIPKARHMPEIYPIIIETFSREGPFGAKGIGEIPSIPIIPAIINAIYNACGVRVYSLPATPERVRAGLTKLK